MKESIRAALSRGDQHHLPDDVLLQAVMGEPLQSEDEAHLQSCELCHGRVSRERAANPVLSAGARWSVRPGGRF